MKVSCLFTLLASSAAWNLNDCQTITNGATATEAGGFVTKADLDTVDLATARAGVAPATDSGQWCPTGGCCVDYVIGNAPNSPGIGFSQTKVKPVVKGNVNTLGDGTFCPTSVVDKVTGNKPCATCCTTTATAAATVALWASSGNVASTDGKFVATSDMSAVAVGDVAEFDGVFFPSNLPTCFQWVDGQTVKKGDKATKKGNFFKTALIRSVAKGDPKTALTSVAGTYCPITSAVPGGGGAVPGGGGGAVPGGGGGAVPATGLPVSTSKSDDDETKIIVGVVVPVVILAGVGFFCWYSKQNKPGTASKPVPRAHIEGAMQNGA